MHCDDDRTQFFRALLLLLEEERRGVPDFERERLRDFDFAFCFVAVFVEVRVRDLLRPREVFRLGVRPGVKIGTQHCASSDARLSVLGVGEGDALLRRGIFRMRNREWFFGW